jgi:protease-4
MLVRLLRLVAWVIALPWLLARRLARPPAGTYVLAEIEGRVEEPPLEGRRWAWLPAPARHVSLHALRDLVDEIARDPRVAGLLLVVRSARGGFATAASLRALIARARAAGKTVVVHLPLGGGTREAYVGVAADRLLLGPQAGLAAVGILSSTRYLRGALDRAGVVPEVYARGRYKTAAEPIERTAMSEAQHEQLEALLGSIHEDVLGAISEGRGLTREQAAAAVDAAPYVGHEAVEAKLADGVAYEDEIPERVAAITGRSARPAIRPAAGYLASRRALRSRAFESAGVIAVVRVHGAIASGAGLPFASVALEERIFSAGRVARADPRVRGVVLHVDSPGGGALASDRIHHELVRLAAEKPLVACLGDVAASGGYYVAAAAHQIVAQRTTITGSIGVISARLVLDPLLARLGVATQVIQRGAHARMLDPFAPLDESARAAVEREIERMYRAFVGVVARGRGRSEAEIEALAQGRVWVGADAHANGLVDRLGGFEDALEVVRARVGRGADRLRVIALRPPRKAPPWHDAAPQPPGALALVRWLESLGPALGFDPAVLCLAGERALAWSPAAADLAR